MYDDTFAKKMSLGGTKQVDALSTELTCPQGRGRFRGVKMKAALMVGLLILTFTPLSSSEGCAMGFSSRLVLFSEVHGTVLKDGKPVNGAELIQQVVWSDNKDEIPAVHTTTDPAGHFSFAVVERGAGATRLLPHQPVILQKILIHYQGIEYIAWRHTKDSYDLNSELGGRALKLTCELSREPDFEGTHYGICKAN